MEAFTCVRLGCKLSVAACCSRRASAKSSIRPGSNRRLLDDGNVCATCELGAAHQRGESPERWPDGSAVVRLRLASAARGPAPARSSHRPLSRREDALTIPKRRDW
jgi:hypothetical protein